LRLDSAPDGAASGGSAGHARREHPQLQIVAVNTTKEPETTEVDDTAETSNPTEDDELTVRNS